MALIGRLLFHWVSCVVQLRDARRRRSAIDIVRRRDQMFIATQLNATRRRVARKSVHGDRRGVRGRYKQGFSCTLRSQTFVKSSIYGGWWYVVAVVVIVNGCRFDVRTTNNPQRTLSFLLTAVQMAVLEFPSHVLSTEAPRGQYGMSLASALALVLRLKSFPLPSTSGSVLERMFVISLHSQNNATYAAFIAVNPSLIATYLFIEKTTYR